MSDQQPRPYNVLFLCTGNSCRSIMAEAIMNRTGAGRFVAHSAGSHPTGAVNPHALALLQRMHHPTDQLWSKPWGLPDPAAFRGSDAETAVVFADTYRMLTNRINLFVNLPISGLDRLSLQKRLDQIGKTVDEPAVSQ
jgi:arsenate reductase